MGRSTAARAFLGLLIIVVVGAVGTTIGTGVLTTWSAVAARPARQLRAEMA